MEKEVTGLVSAGHKHCPKNLERLSVAENGRRKERRNKTLRKKSRVGKNE